MAAFKCKNTRHICNYNFCIFVQAILTSLMHNKIYVKFKLVEFVISNMTAYSVCKYKYAANRKVCNNIYQCFCLYCIVHITRLMPMLWLMPASLF